MRSLGCTTLSPKESVESRTILAGRMDMGIRQLRYPARDTCCLWELLGYITAPWLHPLIAWKYRNVWYPATVTWSNPSSQYARTPN